MNVLVIKEHYDEEEVVVYRLPEDETEAAKAAKKIFFEDLEVEKAECASDIDVNNTWWDDASETGQLQWNLYDANGILCRATYDVTFVTEYK